MPVVLSLLALVVAATAALLSSDRSFSRPPFVNHSPTPAFQSDGPVPGETYKWRPVRIGGGGFITGLDFDATGQTMVARADVHGAYIWDAKADQWRLMVTAASMPPQFHVQNGVNEGVYEVTVAPGDPNRIYMAMLGRVFRSDDRGGHWRPTSDASPFPVKFEPNGRYRYYGPFMAVSPANPDIVFLGTPDRGLWRSMNGGGSWSRVKGVPPSGDVSPAQGKQSPGIAIWFVPTGPRKGSVIAASPGNGLFVAGRPDGDFRPLTEAGYGPTTVARAAFGADGSFYAVENDQQRAWLLRGGQWTDLSANGLTPSAYLGIAVSGDRVMVADHKGAVWCSGNSGDSWNRVYRSQGAGPDDPPWLEANSGGFAIGEIRFDPAKPDRLWVAAGTGPYYADLGRFCLQPLHWNSRARGIEELVATDVVQPSGRAPMFATLDFGIHVRADLDAYSTGYGPKERVIIAAQQVAITPSNRDFAVTNASDTRVGCCMEDGDSVLAGYTLDGGKSWSKFETLPTPPGTNATDPWRMAFGSIAISSGNSDNIVWMPARNRSPFYTLDRGKSWHRVELAGEVLPLTGSFNSIWAQRKNIVADNVNSGTFYLMHSGHGASTALTGLWRTTDGGRNWSQVYRGDIAPHNGGAAKLRAVPGKAGHLFFTSASNGADLRLRRSVNGGENWQIVDGVDHVDDVTFGKAAKGASYPAIYLSGRIRGTYGIWRSVDDARSWQRLTDFPVGRLDQVTAMGADPDIFGRVYIGYMGSGFIYGETSRCRAAPTPPLPMESCSDVAAAIPAGG